MDKPLVWSFLVINVILVCTAKTHNHDKKRDFPTQVQFMLPKFICLLTSVSTITPLLVVSQVCFPSDQPDAHFLPGPGNDVSVRSMQAHFQRLLFLTTLLKTRGTIATGHLLFLAPSVHFHMTLTWFCYKSRAPPLKQKRTCSESAQFSKCWDFAVAPNIQRRKLTNRKVLRWETVNDDWRWTMLFSWLCKSLGCFPVPHSKTSFCCHRIHLEVLLILLLNQTLLSSSAE